jgi:uncharacterized protein YbbK (DUF523 family)
MFQPQRFFHAASATAHAAAAISACLTGQRVRYDGDHKQLAQWEQVLAAELELLPICPEVGAGLGVPRPPVQLVAVAGQPEPRALGRIDPQLDVTAALRDFAARSVAELRRQPRLCGYLWQSRSPSCGSGSTPLFDPAGRQIGVTSGIHAAQLERALPWLACAEDTAVADASGAWHFVLRCRLVFDALQTDAAALPALHRHYAFIVGDRPAGAALPQTALAGDKIGYLTAFTAACGRLPAARLLELFSR